MFIIPNIQINIILALRIHMGLYFNRNRKRTRWIESRRVLTILCPRLLPVRETTSGIGTHLGRARLCRRFIGDFEEPADNDGKVDHNETGKDLEQSEVSIEGPRREAKVDSPRHPRVQTPSSLYFQ